MTATPADLPPLDVSGRLGSVVGDLDDAGCDVLVVSGRSNVRWLTGFTGSAGVAVVWPEGAVLVTDARYGARAVDELGAAASPFRVVVADSARDEVRRVLGGGARLGLEADHVSWSQQRGWAEVCDGSELVAVTGLVEAHRVVKDDAELVRMRTAAAVADAALAEVLPTLATAPTEHTVSAALADAIRRNGADDVAFTAIVASGPNAARPHHTAGRRRIGRGELVIIDLGAQVDGYRSDMTRTISVGEPSDGDRELFELVVAAQEAGVAAVRPGAVTGDVDAACRAVIAEAGHGDAFVHGAGHGVGLDVHEAPRVSRRASHVLSAGTALTVEPGVYLPDRTGVRIEDTVVVGTDGAHRITGAPKTLVV